MAQFNGSMLQAMQGAEELFAASATFQTRTGKSAAELKASRIPFGELSLDELGQLDPSMTIAAERPFVLLAPETDGYNNVHQGSFHTLIKNCSVLALITDTPQGNSHKESYSDFMGFASKVMDEVSEKVGTDPYFPFSRITLYIPPYRPPVGSRESDDFWIAAWTLWYDVRGPG
jgi:hypothetical protein